MKTANAEIDQEASEVLGVEVLSPILRLFDMVPVTCSSGTQGWRFVD